RVVHEIDVISTIPVGIDRPEEGPVREVRYPAVGEPGRVEDAAEARAECPRKLLDADPSGRSRGLAFGRRHQVADLVEPAQRPPLPQLVDRHVAVALGGPLAVSESDGIDVRVLRADADEAAVGIL